jgi:hypothetical protein
MPYLNTDDGFPEHEKVDVLSDGAFRLHVAAMHFCAKHLTDGLVPVRRVSRLKPDYKRGQLGELLDGELWHKGGEGCGDEHCPKGARGFYVVHDYLEWNKSKAWWESKRRAEADRIAKWRQEKREGGAA